MTCSLLHIRWGLREADASPSMVTQIAKQPETACLQQTHFQADLCKVQPAAQLRGKGHRLQVRHAAHECVHNEGCPRDFPLKASLCL